MAEGLFEGKLALVTGGSSGIGLATVQRLTREGASCAVVDLQPPPAGVGEAYVEADVGDPTAWPVIVEQVESRLGGIDLAHLNAGVTTGEAPIDALTDEQYRRIMHVNVDGVVFGVRAVVPAMRRRGGGRIVCTASLAGLMGWGVDPIYSVTKHAVVGLVRSLGEVLTADGITINAINPGIVDTPLVAPHRDAILAAGFPLIEAADAAGAVALAMASGRSGECWVIQPGRDPLPYHFAGIPGPRVAGAEGMRPPLD